MKSKQNIIYDLIEISRLNGIHTGEWENEYNRDDSTEEYLNEMESYARQYGIEYDENLENYREFESDDETILKDKLSYVIFELLKDQLINLLFKKENIEKYIEQLNSILSENKNVIDFYIEEEDIVADIDYLISFENDMDTLRNITNLKNNIESTMNIKIKLLYEQIGDEISECNETITIDFYCYI